VDLDGNFKNPYLQCGFQHMRYVDHIVQLDLRGDALDRYQLSHRDLLYLMNNVSALEATDPRDKVFVVLGLSNKITPLNPFLGQLKPTYEKPVQKVYVDVARYLILATGRLDILRACVGSGTITRLPSWTPDWTVKLMRDTAGMPRWRKPFSLLDAAGLQNPVAHFSADSKLMTLKGFVVGVLSGPSEFSLVPSAPSTFSYETQIEMITWVTWIQSWIFWVMLLLFKIPGARTVPRIIARRDPKGFGFYFEFLADAITASSKKRPPNYNSSAVGVMVDIDFPEREMPVLTQFLVADFRVDSPWSMLMITCETYAKAIEGDMICMLLGADVPFLIRKEKKRHILVGPATFGGVIQDGMIWNKISEKYTDGRAKLQSFTLS
jgi:hypothetical protein